MSHNSDDHVQVTIGSSKTTLIREKESGRLLVDLGQTTDNGGVSLLVTKDIEATNLLKEILAEMKIQTKHLECMSGEEL
jgi:hypothetical protein